MKVLKVWCSVRVWYNIVRTITRINRLYVGASIDNGALERVETVGVDVARTQLPRSARKGRSCQSMSDRARGQVGATEKCSAQCEVSACIVHRDKINAFVGLLWGGGRAPPLVPPLPPSPMWFALLLDSLSMDSPGQYQPTRAAPDAAC
jgi:hypothetical protein